MATNMDRTLRQFLDAIRPVKDLDGLRSVYDEAMRELGFRYFTYHIVRVAGIGNHLPYVITTYPDYWVQHYIERDYVHIDPLISEGPKQMLPFAWNELVTPAALDNAQATLFREADDLRIADGMSVPVHGHGGEFAMMTVVPDGTAAERRRTVAEHRNLIHLMGLYYHNQTGGLLLDAHMKEDRPALTPREQEVLRWTANGKSTWEISEILNISERTVLFHIENAKKKLRVFSRPHAVVKAMMLGLIFPDA